MATEANGLLYPWTLHVADESPEQSSFGRDNQRSTLVMKLAGLQRGGGFAVSDFVGDLLGYPVVEGVNMHRVMPFRHTRFPWLFCTSVEMVGRKWAGKQQEAAGPSALYDYDRFTLGFESLPYAVLTDSQASGQEWKRYTEWRYRPAVENILIPRGELTFVEGPYAGQKFQGQVSQRLAKTYITAIWHDVPNQFLFSEVTGLPNNLLNALGKVNQYEWAGFPAGTLLMLEPQLDPVMAPVDPGKLGLAPTDIPRLWRVTFNFVFFDPPVNPFFDDFRGHVLAPSPQLDSPYWYFATSDGTVDGTQTYRPYPFAQLFQRPTT